MRAGDLSPIDYVETLLEYISQQNPRLHAFVSVTADIARAQAETAAGELKAGNWKGPLHGIPYGLKDIIDYDGVLTTAQSRLLRDNLARQDAGVVHRLKSQGAILLGKLATDEFACGGRPSDSLWPIPVNPWNPDYITAGSSSGSAVGVAAGMLPLALGTDTAGSIRNPAARCGLVGMKPTYGRVSRAGVIPLAPSMDHVGPMTRTVLDNALALQAIAGADPNDPATLTQPGGDFIQFPAHLKGVRVALARDVYADHPANDAEQASGIDTLVAVLRDAGAKVHEIHLEALDNYNHLSRLLLSVEAYAVHEPWLKTAPKSYGRRCLERLLQGALLSAADYSRLLQLRQRYTRQINTIFDDADLLITASGYDATPRVDDQEGIRQTYHHQIRMLFNMTGHPALVLPTGLSKVSGTPLAAQIIGRHHEEATIYRAASIYEQQHSWHKAYELTIKPPACT